MYVGLAAVVFRWSKSNLTDPPTARYILCYTVLVFNLFDLKNSNYRSVFYLYPGLNHYILQDD